MDLHLEEFEDIAEIDEALGYLSDTIRRHTNSPRLARLREMADDLLDVRLAGESHRPPSVPWLPQTSQGRGTLPDLPLKDDASSQSQARR
jgi:hypothetical protein